jgi:NADH:ubiquinone oxidoreductase subunit 6 (subunit J)
MNGADIATLALCALAIVPAVAAIAARTLFASIASLAAASAIIAAALFFAGAPLAGLVAALSFVALCPVVLLGAVLLTARSSKRGRSLTQWLGVLAASLVAVVVMIGVDLGDLGDARPVNGDPSMLGWVGLVLFASAVGCVALLGFGEAGALEGREP